MGKECVIIQDVVLVMVMVEMFVTVDAFEVELEVGVVALVQHKASVCSVQEQICKIVMLLMKFKKSLDSILSDVADVGCSHRLETPSGGQ